MTTQRDPRRDQSDPVQSALSASGRPVPCLVTGGLMLAVPAVSGLATMPVDPVGGRLLLGAPLAIGALAVGLATARPHGSPMPVLALLCAATALLSRPAPLAAGLCGLAGLAFLLAVRLHRQVLDGPVDVAEWLAAHRPMLVGAAITTPAAIAAGAVPSPWSLPLAASVAAIAAAAFR
jgi:hypothetical protein